MRWLVCQRRTWDDRPGRSTQEPDLFKALASCRSEMRTLAASLGSVQELAASAAALAWQLLDRPALADRWKHVQSPC